MTKLEIRPLSREDSFESLTGLLHRAYAPLAKMGFRYLATYQDVTVTRDRAAQGECYVVTTSGRLIGTLLVVPPERRAPHCDWYDRPDVAVLSQFAVEPELQRRGVGTRLLCFGEQRALELGASEVSVDTAESAFHLIRLYEKRGYREVGHAQWKHTNYRSVLLSKRLLAPT